MGRRYSASFRNVAVTAAQDIFSLVVASNEPIKILAAYLSQNTEAGDSEEEFLELQWVRGNGTVGSGGSALDERPLDSKEGAASASARANDTTAASAGTEQIMHVEAWNIRVPWIYLPTPETQIRVDNDDDIIALRLMAAPSDSITMCGTIYWEEG